MGEVTIVSGILPNNIYGIKISKKKRKMYTLRTCADDSFVSNCFLKA